MKSVKKDSLKPLKLIKKIFTIPSLLAFLRPIAPRGIHARCGTIYNEVRFASHRLEGGVCLDDKSHCGEENN